MGVVLGKTGTSENQATVLSIQATICSHIYIKSFVKETFSTIDLEDHLGKVELWKKTAPCDSFAYHPYATYTSEEESTRPEEDSDRESHNEGEDEQILKTSKKGLLFVHQSKDQRRLLERYGNEICMLDATYKTQDTASLFSLLLSRLTLTIRLLVLALFKVRRLMLSLRGCPFWSHGTRNGTYPSCFMVDYSEDEMSAIG